HILRAPRYTSALSVLCYTAFLRLRPAPSTTLFPYTTLFRSPFAVQPARSSRAATTDPRILVTPRIVAIGGSSRRSDGLQTSGDRDRKSTRLNSSHVKISYAVFCLKKKNTHRPTTHTIRSTTA